MIDTLKHETIVYKVHDLLLEQPIRWHSVQELCVLFYGEHTSTNDRWMREICRIVAMSQVFHKIIISGHKGYKVAETKEEFQAYRDGLRNTYRSLQERLKAIDYKSMHDEQFRLPNGEYDEPVFEAYVHEGKHGQMQLEV